MGANNTSRPIILNGILFIAFSMGARNGKAATAMSQTSQGKLHVVRIVFFHSAAGAFLMTCPQHSSNLSLQGHNKSMSPYSFFRCSFSSFCVPVGVAQHSTLNAITAGWHGVATCLKDVVNKAWGGVCETARRLRPITAQCHSNLTSAGDRTADRAPLWKFFFSIVPDLRIFSFFFYCDRESRLGLCCVV